MGLRASGRRERHAAAGLAGTGPLLLSIDTSGSRLNVALSRGSELLAFHSALHPFSHAAALLPVIDLLLEGQRVTVADLEGVGLCIGPGSFTGLRVGMTTAKAIAAPGRLPVAAVTSTLLLAAGSGATGLVAPLIDARRGEVYSALYQVGATAHGACGPDAELPVEMLAPEAGTPEGSLTRVLEASAGPVMLVGSACVTYAALLRDKGADRIALAPASRCSISAEVLAQLCSQRLKAGLTADAGQLEPLYVGRPPIHGK